MNFSDNLFETMYFRDAHEFTYMKFASKGVFVSVIDAGVNLNVKKVSPRSGGVASRAAWQNWSTYTISVTSPTTHEVDFAKTCDSDDCSPVVTHLITSLPVHCLSTAEQTGSSIFNVLWSHV